MSGSDEAAAAEPAAADETALWLKEMRELCEVSMDAEAIRRKLQGRVVPSSLRGIIWQVLMRVRSKPDALTGQALPVSESDTPIKRDCAELAQRFCTEAEAADAALEMVGILGFYARSRGVEYDASLGWAELLAPFMAVPLSKGDRYNCFYVLMSKYAVKDLSQGSPCFEVFRLLLMYHDPELCNLLDSLKIGPTDFAATWIRSMFAHWCGPQVTLPLWDAYFLAEDQFFVFFLSLVMLINGRDYVMQLAKDPGTLAKELESLPSQLSADDITDMCDLAEHFSMVTPQSFRADYSSKVFGSGSRRITASDDMFGTMCLSVPVETILRHSEGAIKFFVVDTRPLAQYDAAHLSYAWHLDASLMMEKPKIFAEELARVEDALASSMQHPCFLHTGDDEDAGQLGMIVSQFLQKHHKYVSVVKGGFAALERRVESYGAGASKYLVRQQIPGRLAVDKSKPAVSPETGADEASEGAGWGTRVTSWRNAAKGAYSKSAAKLAEKSALAKQAAKERSKQLAEKYAEYKGKSKKDPKAQYRGKDRSLRSELEDDDDSDQHRNKAAEAELAGALSTRMCTAGKLVCTISKLAKLNQVSHVFKCSEVDSEGFLYPSQLVLTKTHVLKLRDRTSRESELLERRHLMSIAKITAKKKHPNLMTLVFEIEPPSHPASATPSTASQSVAGPDSTLDSDKSHEPKSEPVFSIGDVGDDEDRSVSSVEPIEHDPAANDETQGLSAPTSEETQNTAAASPTPSFVELREMFMVPEAAAAKAAFRDLIAELQAEDKTADEAPLVNL